LIHFYKRKCRFHIYRMENKYSFKRIILRLLLSLSLNQFFVFIFSFVIGAILASAFHNYSVSLKNSSQPAASSPYDYAYEIWLLNQGLKSEVLDPDLSRYNSTAVTESEFLYDKISVTCLVFPLSVENAEAINATWGQHCNHVYFFSHKFEDSKIPIKKLTGVSSEFGLFCSTLHTIQEELGDKLEWLLITTDDTFAIPENLRYYVAPYKANHSYYLGHAMKFWNQIYNWRDAGIVLSRGALSKLFSKFPTSKSCANGGKYWRNGDWYLGKHLSTLGVHVRDTRDHRGRGRFNGYSFKKLLFPGAVSLFERYWKDSLFLAPDGPTCCSNHAITFHGILSMSKMYQLEYLFHHLRPFPYEGVYGNAIPPPRPDDPFLTIEEKLKNEMMEAWLNSQLTTSKYLNSSAHI